MRIKFFKMHGIGNDYIYIDCFNKELPNPGDVAKKMSPRHYSVGADGVVLICKSIVADAKMRMFNADGSEGKMCGNAIRCVGKYLYENLIVKKDYITIETLSGIKKLWLTVGEDGFVTEVKVDMGVFSTEPKDIPILADKPMINAAFEVDGKTDYGTAVSVGNPHLIVYRDEVDSLELDKFGSEYEHLALFPEGVNTEFVKVIDKNNLQMRVWERGSGETYACGTGSCAVAAASILNGYCRYNEEIKIKLIGGVLKITVTDEHRVFMTGPATLVYIGEYEYAD